MDANAERLLLGTRLQACLCDSACNESLVKILHQKFEETYVYVFLKSVDGGVLLLDYCKDGPLKDDDLYFNSFFLNKEEHKFFTEQTLNDIGVEK